MKDILKDFEYLNDAVEKIDSLVEEARKERKKIEKRKLLIQAQELADAYQEHCEAGGNHVKQFNPFV